MIRRHHSEEDWIESTFIRVEILHYLFSFKGLLILGFVFLAVAAWNPDGSPEQLTGELRDQSTRQPVSNAALSLSDAKGMTISHARSDENGVFQFEVKENQNYQLLIEKDGYDTRTVNATRAMNDAKDVVLHIALKPLHD